MKHNNDFRHDLEVGQKGEKLLEDMIEGDKIEVKSEQTKIPQNWCVSGNCYVEYESRDKKSGLAHTESKWWAINFYVGDEHYFTIMMPTERLKKITRRYYEQKGGVEGGDSNTSMGVLVPISALIAGKNIEDTGAPESFSEEDIVAWALAQDNF